MSLSRADVDRVAVLSRLELSEDAKDAMAEQLSRVLDYMEKLDELDTEGVEPMSHPGELHNVFREDEPRESLGADRALANAPDRSSSFFRVPRVIE